MLPDFAHTCHEITFLDNFVQFAGYPRTLEFTIGGIVVSARSLRERFAATSAQCEQQFASHTEVPGERASKISKIKLVKLSGNNANGIYFDADSWQEFLHNMRLMSEYLTGDNKLKSNPVTIKNIYISFTTANGARSI